MSAELLTLREGNVLQIKMNRPEKKNAVTGVMYRGRVEALQEADRDDAIGAVVVTGGGNCFTSGNDISDFLLAGLDKEAPGVLFLKTLATCETPIVAGVEGVAVGIGTTMIFHCDLVYAAPTALFRMPFVDLGLVPEAGSSLLVPRCVGFAKTTELLMLGDSFGAEEAVRLGIANAVVASDRLLGFAMDKAAQLAAKPRKALAATRRLIRGDTQLLLRRIDEELERFAAALQTDEARSAFNAFLARKAG